MASSRGDAKGTHKDLVGKRNFQLPFCKASGSRLRLQPNVMSKQNLRILNFTEDKYLSLPDIKPMNKSKSIMAIRRRATHK